MSQDGFFASIKRFFGQKQIAPLPTSQAEALYHQILQASRAVPLYRDYGVEDSIDGRFDALCLMQSLVMRRLSVKTGDENTALLAGLNQELFDAMFADMDLTLREMGVGDMGVGKRVKFMSEAYMGRLTAYDNALKSYEAGKGLDQLEEALKRNLFRDGACAGNAKGLSEVVAAISAKIASFDEAVLLAGRLPDETFVIASQT